MTAEVFDQRNKKAGTIELADGVWGVKWNPRLVHQVLTSERSSARRPLAHTKGRGEVRGGGRKPWAQKHTGRARHGSTRSPLWVGGGVTHGPRKDRDFERKVNKKMKRAAIRAVLSKKFKDDEIRIIDTLRLDAPKTKAAAAFLKNFFETRQSILFIPAKDDKTFVRAARNIPKTEIMKADSLNLYGCLAHKYIFFDKKAIAELKL